MNTDMLKEYLGIVVDMEENIFLQERLLNSMAERIKRLGVPQTFTRPTQIMRPSKPNKMGSFLAAALYALFSPILLPIYLWTEDGFGLMAFYVGIIWGILAFLAAVSETLVIIGIAVLLFLVFLVRLKEIESSYQEKNKKWIDFEAEMAVYNNNKKIDDERVARENTEKAFWVSEIAEMEKRISSSKKILTSIYGKDLIFPKYRNLIAVCSLYEYICAGRCSSLEGYEGAYNIYEAEIRLDRIITQLDKVIIYLDAIQKNQFMLYSAIQDMNQRSTLILESTQTMAGQLHALNRQTGNVSEQIAELQKNSALTAYHAERTQKELAYMNRMDYLSGRNDDVFFNHPPV